MTIVIRLKSGAVIRHVGLEHEILDHAALEEIFRFGRCFGPVTEIEIAYTSGGAND